MKLFFLAFLIPFGCLIADSSSVGLLPQEKTAIVISADERNPFGSRIEAPKAAEVKRVEGQEAAIRNVITGLKISGVINSGGKMKVLLGSMLLAEEQVMPPVMPHQRDRLYVTSITPTKVEISFVDANGSVGDRKIVLPINLDPAVRHKLGSESLTDKSVGNPPPALGGVISKDAPTQ